MIPRSDTGRGRALAIPSLATTGVGSLPHKTVSAGLEQAFRVDVPYLPQLPLRDPREFMLPQALEGMPGVVADEQGAVVLDVETWKKGRAKYDDKLYLALEKDDLREFLPSADYLAAWEPFLARVRDEARPVAKIQLAGPMTLQWTLRTADGQIPPAGALTHVSRTVLARALAMADALSIAGAAPMFFVDEPGLYAFSRNQPGHIVMLQELRILIMALKKRGARVGLHCCSDADWGALMGLGLDLLGIDARLSLRSLLQAGEALVTFVSMGGRLALGVIPTSHRDEVVEPQALLADMQAELKSLEQYFPTRSAIFETILGRSMLTPACGMAFLSEPEASSIAQQLADFRALYRGA
ncbi:MAG: hypothetical protein U1E65_09300 [Myxococcota bacterium]